MTAMNLDLKSKSEWIEVFPFGIAMGLGQPRPVMIFKDEKERRVLPVWLSPLDAGIAVAQGNSPYTTGAEKESSPHELAAQVLSSLGVKLDKCLFKKMSSNLQYVELHFVKSENAKKSDKPLIIQSKADSAISFCLRSGCKFFATVDYIERSRVMEGEILLSAPQMESYVNPHPYLN